MPDTSQGVSSLVRRSEDVLLDSHSTISSGDFSPELENLTW